MTICSMTCIRATDVRLESTHDSTEHYYTGCANKKNNPLKLLYISNDSTSLSQFEPNFCTLYKSIRTTYRENFIKTTDMIQEIYSSEYLRRTNQTSHNF